LAYFVLIFEKCKICIECVVLEMIHENAMMILFSDFECFL